jgi:hypothetical protein
MVHLQWSQPDDTTTRGGDWGREEINLGLDHIQSDHLSVHLLAIIFQETSVCGGRGRAEGQEG